MHVVYVILWFVLFTVGARRKAGAEHGRRAVCATWLSRSAGIVGYLE